MTIQGFFWLLAIELRQSKWLDCYQASSSAPGRAFWREPLNENLRQHPYAAQNHAHRRGIDDSDNRRARSEGLGTRRRLSVRAALSQRDRDPLQEGMAICYNARHI